MSIAALAASGGPALRIRGATYPVLLPSPRDPRLHLAAVIVSLQVLGQAAFDFRLSIAQILIAVVTCAVLEVAIAFRRQQVILWPASALLTGNGVAFILRVPGTEHGDWWSLRGAWIFAAAAAVSLLSKYLIRFRGRHVFNPSNLGLVLCFLLLGPERADPLDFWWGPMSPWLALALALIVAGGLAILLRLRLLEIAVGFWLAFALAIGVLALSGHAMSARWHLGPVTDGEFWRVLVFSPEILVFLFFMISDPKTVPESRGGRRAYAVAIALLAALLIAPQTTEFASKVAVLGALAIVCAARPLSILLSEALSRNGLSGWAARAGAVAARRGAAGSLALGGSVACVALLVLAGIPARSTAGAASTPARDTGSLPVVTIAPSRGVAGELARGTALQIARDLVADLRIGSEALRRRDAARAAGGAGGAWLEELRRRIRTAGATIAVPAYSIERLHVGLEPGEGQSPPIVVATLHGKVQTETYRGSPAALVRRGEPEPFERTLELAQGGSRYLIVGSREGTEAERIVTAPRHRAGSGSFAGVRLTDVAERVGLRFRQGAFRFRVSADPVAMMGGGVCWLDFDGDGWIDLFVVNSYAEYDFGRWERQGGLPRSALFRNVKGRFVDVSRGSGANVRLRGNGCVAADLNGDGRTDLYVTAAGSDALLWNTGGGRFVEGARAAGLAAYGWHAGAAVGDVNGDGRPDLFVAGYTDVNAPIPGSAAGFPANHQAVRDLLYLNLGPDRRGRSRFREVAARAGIEAGRVDHGLGAVFTDVNGDGRLDLHVANDLDPNRLYLNVPWPGGAAADPAGLGFRLRERGREQGVADPNAGMGIAAADYSADGRVDLFVTNTRGQRNAAYRSRPGTGARSFTDTRLGFTAALGTAYTGWGASWADLDLDGDLDLVLANGAIPVTSLARDAEPVQAVEIAPRGPGGRLAAGPAAGLRTGPRVNGRGLAAADFDNDGRLDFAVNTIGGPLLLLRSTGATGHWLQVQLATFAPGAVVTAVLPDGRRLVREVQAGSSYLSSEDPRVHFGLGAARRVRELVVRFPGGRETRLADVAADRLVVVGP